MSKPKNLLGILIVVSVFIFFARINSTPLKNWDEAWYAEISRNMTEGPHGYLMPFWNSEYYFDKPPLYFWLSTPIFFVFGSGEWQARVISAVAGVGCVILIYLIAKKLFNEKVGFFSSLVFISLGQVVRRFSEGNLDALLVFLFLGAFYFYLLSNKNKIFSVLAGVFIGLGFLTKGWLLGLFPILLITVYSIANEKKLPRNWLIICLTTVISSGWWYLWGIARFGQSFINWYIFSPAAGDLKGPFANFSLRYFYYLVRDVGIWLPVTLIGVIVSKEKIRANKSLLTFSVAVFLLTFFLNFLKEKFDWYILPAYPLVAIFAGFAMYELSNKFKKLTLPLLILFLLINAAWIYYAHSKYPDKSFISADLGRSAKKNIPKEDLVFLDSSDFPSFLYYSELGKIYVLSKSGGKPFEWWIVKPEKITTLIDKSEEYWIISKDFDDLGLSKKPSQILEAPHGYMFFRI